MIRQEIPDGTGRDLQRLVLRVSVDPGGDQRKGDGFTAGLLRKPERFPVAGGQQAGLPMGAAPPDGTDGMDDEPAGKAVAPGHFGLPGPAAVQGAAFRQQLRSGGSVDRAVHSPAAQQGRIGGIDDGIHLHPGDIIADNFKRHRFSPFVRHFQLDHKFKSLYQKSRNAVNVPGFRH